ncbi:MAG: hypothetical protein P1P84_09160 [Deferrisomatales bacterium]|nr:hypothetical protein [Deferrisomatales bacterium]
MFREGVRQVVVSQFMLHETQHHPDRLQGETGPRMPRAHTLGDIYKCLHQGEFGPGHMIDDAGRFLERLTEEVHLVPAGGEEPVLESLAPDDSIFRLNLRPFKSLFPGEEVDNACRVLSLVCSESAGLREGTPERFFHKLTAFQTVNDAQALVADGTLFVYPAELVAGFLRDTLALARASQGVAVLGHSPGYHQLNAPSYRVVEEVVLKGSPLAFLMG